MIKQKKITIYLDFESPHLVGIYLNIVIKYFFLIHVKVDTPDFATWKRLFL